MAIDPFIPSSISARRNGQMFVGMRGQLDDLQRQLATRQKHDSFAEMGLDVRISLDVRAKIGMRQGWTKAIDQGDMRIKFLMQSVEGFAKQTLDGKSDARPGGFVQTANGQVAGQILATERLKQSIDLLNVDVDGRYLFSGRSQDVKPVASFDDIMKDPLLPGPAGVRTLIDQRYDADRGVNDLGRLTTTVAGAAVTIARETPLPDAGYGFQVSAAISNAPGVAATFTAGPPASAGFNVTAPPAPGGKIAVTVAMPDGKTRTIELEARAEFSTGPAETGFNVDPASNANTAANLDASIRAALQKETRTQLQAFSAITAARDFFAGSNTNQPPRIPGPGPYTTVTAPQAAGAPGATLIWYKGDDDAAILARNTAPLQIDDGHTVATGARANEQAFREGMAAFAAFSAMGFPNGDANNRDRYEALTDRVRTTLAFATTQKPSDIGVEIAAAQTSMANAKDRHKTTINMLDAARGEVEDANQEEVASAILALQTRLQATYQTTAILSRLTLTNYLN
jgi:flagellin-like hook-associated protein FlgL